MDKYRPAHVKITDKRRKHFSQAEFDALFVEIVGHLGMENSPAVLHGAACLGDPA